MDYRFYKVEDFAADEYFIHWVKAPDDSSEAFWKAWISKNPTQEETVRQARRIVQLISIKEDVPPEGKYLELWEKIIKTNPEDGVTKMTVSRQLPAKPTRWLYVAAAAIFVITATSSLLYVQLTHTETISTKYGESRTLFLPDSTKVTLNSNTTLTYSPRTFNKGDRLVILNGEAFFAVVHKVSNEKFLVQTKDLTVEVLGTRFNVNSRRGKTKVVLEEGMVNLRAFKKETGKTVTLEPGELVEYSNSDERMVKKVVNTTEYISWKNNELIFVGKTLEEVADLIEDNYGFDVTFLDPEIGQRKFTGSASSDNVSDILNKLSRLFDLEIELKGNTILINKATSPGEVDKSKHGSETGKTKSADDSDDHVTDFDKI